MNEPALLLILMNFAVIGLLTLLFFRKVDGRLGPRWWMTALPSFLCPATLIAAYSLPITPSALANHGRWLALGAVTLAATSLALICLTLGIHRVPLALFHQDNDAPQHIVTHGPYRWVRHPFYTGFILVFLAAATLFPHWLTFVLLAYIVTGLTIAAVREERRLSASVFGEEYGRYIARTGRFVPRFAARGPAEHYGGEKMLK